MKEYQTLRFSICTCIIPSLLHKVHIGLDYTFTSHDPLNRKYVVPIIFIHKPMSKDFLIKTLYYTMHFHQHFTVYDSLEKFAYSEIFT